MAYRKTYGWRCSGCGQSGEVTLEGNFADSQHCIKRDVNQDHWFKRARSGKGTCDTNHSQVRYSLVRFDPHE